MTSAADIEAHLRTLTGAQIAVQVEQAARGAGLRLTTYLKPLGWRIGNLNDLGRARYLAPLTYRRIAALLAGDQIPAPKKTITRNRDTRGPRPLSVASREDLPPRVERDPCPLCGVRGDLGCQHRPGPTSSAPPTPDEDWSALPIAEQVKREAALAGERRRSARSLQTVSDRTML